MPFSLQQVHSDNKPQKSTPNSDIHVDRATEAMLQEIQCRFALLFGGLKSTSIISLGQYAVVSSVIVVLIYLKYGSSTLQI